MFYNNNSSTSSNNNEQIPTVNEAGEAGTKLINYTQESGGKRHFIFEVRAAACGFLLRNLGREVSEEELEGRVLETAMSLGRLLLKNSQIACVIFVGSERSLLFSLHSIIGGLLMEQPPSVANSAML